MKAAEYGCSDAMITLGILYSEGKDVEKDLDKAKEWYRKSLEEDKNVKPF